MFLLLKPRSYALRNRLGRLRPGDGLKTFFLGLLGIGFWTFMYVLSFRVLTYFKTIEGLGDLLAIRLLSMILLVFFSILVFSNIVTSLSTFYISGELEILHSSPVPITDIYRSKFIETIIDSSWMVLIYGLPVFIAYGMVFRVTSAYYLVLLLAVIPFLIIPAGMGIMVTILLVNAFPARRARDVLVLLGLTLGKDPKHRARFIGTGMHGGVIYLRGSVEDYQLGKEVGVAELDENVPEVMADQNAVTTALFNLLDNSNLKWHYNWG